MGGRQAAHNRQEWEVWLYEKWLVVHVGGGVVKTMRVDCYGPLMGTSSHRRTWVISDVGMCFASGRKLDKRLSNVTVIPIFTEIIYCIFQNVTVDPR